MVKKRQLNRWICCQLGAREYYAIPRALQQISQLHSLITDAWVSPHFLPHHLLDKLSPSLSDRHHSELSTASVKAFTPSLIHFEFQNRLTYASGWDSILARNQWFQQNTLKVLKKLSNQLPTDSPPILFSYSYTALELFRYAKQQGWITILGQIDPGIVESQIIEQENHMHPQLSKNYQSPPNVYWQKWQQECQIADYILVNSHWSRKLLVKADVSPQKISIIPLVYSPPLESLTFERQYPEKFSSSRPLRVLFLGQIILRKGLAAILETIPLLENFPVQFIFVGSPQISIPKKYQFHPQVKWLGKIPRSKISLYYQSSDVFLFPTLSDGFGLTQLEAQAWQLPIIASQNCGEVVKHGVNGLTLSTVTPQNIANSIQYLLNSPNELKKFALSCKIFCAEFSLETLSLILKNIN